jgi:hypothetical protein
MRHASHRASCPQRLAVPSLCQPTRFAREASHREQTLRRLSRVSKTRRTETSTISHSGTLSGVLDVALEIARRRRDTLAQLRAALEAGKHEQAITLAKELCGLTHVEESNRTDSRFN